MKKTKIGQEASALTQQQLGNEIREKVQLSSDNYKKICPTEQNEQEFRQLISIVQDTTDDNEAKSKLINSISDVGGCVIRIIRTIVMKG